MSTRFPPLRVDHVSVAVRAIDPALALLRRHLPVRMNQEPTQGYDDAFNWTDFFIGDWKLELIESARPGSFVEQFVARRGEGMHHISLDVPAGTLDDYLADLTRQGLRIVEHARYGDDTATAFISPRTGPGILVQFWELPDAMGRPHALVPDDPVAARDGVRFRVDHVALAVRSLERTTEWFARTFPVEIGATLPGWDGSHRLCTLWLAGFKIELLEPSTPASFVTRFLERRGEGFHHLTVDVDRLDTVVERLAADGIAVVERAEVAGRRTAFVHPRDTHGILLQLWEEKDFGGPRRP